MDTGRNILSPSILSADFCKLGEQIKEVEQAGAEYLHIDVMDGLFVPSISYGMPVIASIRKCSNIFLDVHLMIEKPEHTAPASQSSDAHPGTCLDGVSLPSRQAFHKRSTARTARPSHPREARALRLLPQL